MSQIQEIIDYWLGKNRRSAKDFALQQRRWYRSSAATDQRIAEQFGNVFHQAQSGELNHWLDTTEATLAMIVLLDQFSRNLYRGTAAAFKNDRQAQRISSGLLTAHLDKLDAAAIIVAYHPLHHAECEKQQAKGVATLSHLIEACEEAWQPVVQTNLKSAIEHQQIIQRFGRFPHRNAALGRISTIEERDYLLTRNRHYGQLTEKSKNAR